MVLNVVERFYLVSFVYIVGIMVFESFWDFFFIILIVKRDFYLIFLVFSYRFKRRLLIDLDWEVVYFWNNILVVGDGESFRRMITVLRYEKRYFIES